MKFLNAGRSIEKFVNNNIENLRENKIDWIKELKVEYEDSAWEPSFHYIIPNDLDTVTNWIKDIVEIDANKFFRFGRNNYTKDRIESEILHGVNNFHLYGKADVGLFSKDKNNYHNLNFSVEINKDDPKTAIVDTNFPEVRGIKGFPYELLPGNHTIYRHLFERIEPNFIEYYKNLSRSLGCEPDSLIKYQIENKVYQLFKFALKDNIKETELRKAMFEHDIEKLEKYTKEEMWNELTDIEKEKIQLWNDFELNLWNKFPLTSVVEPNTHADFLVEAHTKLYAKFNPEIMGIQAYIDKYKHDAVYFHLRPGIDMNTTHEGLLDIRKRCLKILDKHKAAYKRFNLGDGNRIV